MLVVKPIPALVIERRAAEIMPRLARLDRANTIRA